MTESDLNKIEAALGLRLPREYRELMRHYPFDADSVAQDCALPDSADRVIEDNVSYRKDGFFGAPWPAHFFSIGNTGFGDALYLDLSLESSPVFCAEHETGEFVKESPSLWAFVDELRREGEQERRREEGRRWWQFWK